MKFRRLAIITFAIITCLSVYSGIEVYATKKINSNITIASEKKDDFTKKIKNEKLNSELSIKIKNFEFNENKIVKTSKEMIAKYEYTKMDKDVYAIDNGDEYILDNGKIVGFISKKNQLENKKNRIITIEEAQKLADAFIEENIKNYEKYKLIGFCPLEGCNQYYFVYMNSLNGFATKDCVNIKIDTQGNIISYTAFFEGAFEKYASIEIDEEIIKTAISEKLHNDYGNNLLNINIIEKCLTIIDGTLYMNSLVELQLNDNTNNEDNNYNYEYVLYKLN